MNFKKDTLKVLNETLLLVTDYAEKLENFVEPLSEESNNFIDGAKILFDSLKALNQDRKHLIPFKSYLNQLLIKDFDLETVWQQIRMENESCVKNFKHFIDELNSDRQNSLNSSAINEKSENCDENSAASEDNDSGSDESIEMNEDEEANSIAEEYAFDDDSSDECPDDLKVQAKSVSKARQKSEVDDRFFKLSEMEEFLQLEDLKDAKGQQSSSEDEDGDIDMFEDIPSEYSASDEETDDDDADSTENGNSGSNKQNKRTAGRQFMYEDFFDPPEADINEAQQEKEKHNKRTENVEETKDEAKPELTAFEKQQSKEQKRMREMEESLLQPKPWQLTGEVAASSRPKNSLIHQPTTFDVTAKAELDVTDDLDKRIEDIVKNAIKNKAWNDPERKVKLNPEERPYKQPIQLEQTKSEKSLAEIYEAKYLRMQNKPTEEEEDPKHVEIKELMRLLTSDLTALFSYIPQPPVPEIKVVSNVPAVTVEDVAPVGVSDAALLAPEEVKAKRKDSKSLRKKRKEAKIGLMRKKKKEESEMESKKEAKRQPKEDFFTKLTSQTLGSALKKRKIK